MSTEIKILEECKTYIFKERWTSHPTIMKVLVMEVTEQTYYLHNLDGNIKFRSGKDIFEKYDVIETVATLTPQKEKSYADQLRELNHNKPVYKSPLQQVQEDKPLQEESLTGLIGVNIKGNVVKYEGSASIRFDNGMPSAIGMNGLIFLPQQPETKDKPFVWTTQLVNEFACKLVMSKQGIAYTAQDFINEKQSKQSPTNLQESKDLIEKTVGMPIHSGEPQPYTTVKDKQEWEIVEYKVDGSIWEKRPQDRLLKCITDEPFAWSRKYGAGYMVDRRMLIHPREINAVRRLSDGEVFSCQEDAIAADGQVKKITSFTIETPNHLQVHFGSNVNGLGLIKKLPTPTTDTIITDNTDVPILSVNDVMGFFRSYFEIKNSMNPTHGEIRDAMIDVANQKLKQ